MEQIDKPSPTPAPAPRRQYLGAVDEDRAGRLGGWAITHQGDPCEVEVHVNGRVFRATSEGPRPDLAAKGQARGQGGWRVTIADALEPGDNRVEIRLPDGTELHGSPRTVAHTPAPPAPVRYLGAIDRASGAILSGWALTATGEPCAVQVRIGDAEPTTVMSDGTRADLAAKGMSNGAGGWHLFPEGRLAPGPNRVAISFPDGTPLPGSPLVIEGAAVAEPTPRPVDTPPLAAVDQPMLAPVPAPAPVMPSLAELDELSLDDLALAVASGRVQVDAPPPPEPVPAVEAEQAAPPPPEPRRRGGGWLRRVLG